MVRHGNRWSIADDVDDGAEYVRPGMRPPTDRELDEDGLSLGGSDETIIDNILSAFHSLENGPVGETLPGCQQAKQVRRPKDDIGGRTKAVVGRRKHHRRSRAADARLIQAKRTKEVAICAHRSVVTEAAEGRQMAVPAIENVEKEALPSVGKEAGSKDVSISSSSMLEAEVPDGEEDDDIRTGSTLVPWWQKAIRGSLFTDEDGSTHDNPSIKRRSIPQWRDLCDEARCDFYQDAGTHLAAALPNHGLFHVTINLSHEVEKRAVDTPNALEWAKYRISKAMAASGLPCSFLMVSEEASVKSLDEQDRRQQLGLNPSRRYHLHVIAVLPRNRRAQQKLRDALRSDAVMGAWDEKAKRKQIDIRSGDRRYVVDYLAKDLHLAGARHRRHDGVRGGIKYRSYHGRSITVSRDLRNEAIRIYEVWRGTA